MSGLSVIRRRARGLVLFFVVFCVGGIIFATWIDGGSPPSSFNSAACLPWRNPTSVADINRQITKYRQSKDFLGADVGADGQLSDGRSVWLFGDTMRSPDFKGPQFVRNSMLLFSPGCASVVMPRDKGAVIPDRDQRVGYWPMSVVVVPQDGYDIVGISAQRVRTTGTGAFDFEVLGPAVALFTVHPGKAPQLSQVRDFGPDHPSKRRPMWGAALAQVDDMIYIYATSNPGDGSAYGFELKVARAHVKQVLTPREWRYWDGANWVPQARRAAAVIPSQGGVSQVLSVFQRAGSWYAVSKRDEFLGSDLIIWKAPTPHGPFIPSAPLAQIPSDTKGGLLRYMPLAHPNLPVNRRGSVVVSYSRNVVDPKAILRNPTRYRPKFLEVPLP